MKKNNFILMCLLCLFLVACTNDNESDKVASQSNSEEEKSIGALAKEISIYDSNKEYTKAIEVYEELEDLTGDNYDESKKKLAAKDKGYKNDIRVVNEIKEYFDEVLLNPESLQIHTIFIHKLSMDSEDYEIYVDYSAMNKMGGYVREYLEWEVKNNSLQNPKEIDAEEFELNVEILQRNSGWESYEFDTSLIED